MKVAISILMFAALPLLMACGSDNVGPVSKGQQLTDLQQAYQSRAITDNEYEDEKEKILDK